MIQRIYWLGLSITCLFLAVGGQVAPRSDNAPSTCEEVRHAYDEAIAHSQKSNQSKIIFIFREARKETKRDLTRLRIRALIQHVRFRGSEPGSFVFARGEKAAKLGTLEIYVEGRLEWQLFASKNATFGTDCTKPST